MNVFERKPAGQGLEEASACEARSKKHRILEYTHKPRIAIDPEAKRLEGFANESDVLDLENLRAVRWIDGILDYVAATPLGIMIRDD